MKFIELTKVPGCQKLFVNPSAISAALQKEGKSNLYIVGDSIPFEVLEKADYIMILIKNANNNA